MCKNYMQVYMGCWLACARYAFHFKDMEFLPCAHAFHPDCLDEFCAQSNVGRLLLPCPTCRSVPALGGPAPLAERMFPPTQPSDVEMVSSGDEHVPAAQIDRDPDGAMTPPRRATPPPGATTPPAMNDGKAGSPASYLGSPQTDPPLAVAQPPSSPLGVVDALQQQTQVQDTVLQSPPTDDEVPLALLGGKGRGRGSTIMQQLGIMPTAPDIGAPPPKHAAPTNAGEHTKGRGRGRGKASTIRSKAAATAAPAAVAPTVPAAQAPPPPPAATAKDAAIPRVPPKKAAAAAKTRPAPSAKPSPPPKQKAASEARPKPAEPKSDAPQAHCDDFPIMGPEMLWCCLCGCSVHKDMARLKSKVEQTFKCPQCHSSCTKMHKAKIFPKMDSWSKEGVAEFFESLKNQSQAQTEKLCRDAVEKYTMKEKFYDEGGKFRPLSVWERKGYNIEHIEAKSAPCDRQYHAVLGPTFRVALVGSGTHATEGVKRSQELVQTDSQASSSGPQVMAIPVQRPSEDIKTLEARVKAELALKREEIKQDEKRAKIIQVEVTLVTSTADKLKETMTANKRHLPSSVIDSVEALLVEASTTSANLRAKTASPDDAKLVAKKMQTTLGLLKTTIKSATRFA